jgi:FkbM family methyltransferase
MEKPIVRLVSVLGWRIKLHGFAGDYYFNHITEETADNDVWSVGALLIKPNSIVLDVGANIGYETSVFAKFADKGTVHSFEPIKSNVELIKKTAHVNKLTNIKIHKMALGEKEQVVTIVYNDENRGGATIINDKKVVDLHENKQKIQVKTLDNWYADNASKVKACDLIKVDIEGHEPSFLKGARKFILKFKPALIVEVNHWVLDGINRVTIPDYLDQLFSLYPYIAAFHGDEWIDVGEERYRFMYENMVLNKFKNLYCDFSKDRWQQTILRHKGEWQFLGESAKTISKLTKETDKLVSQNKELITTIHELEKKLQQAGIKARIKKKVRNMYQ